jgi:predicted XRE-type DNA-binding protein
MRKELEMTKIEKSSGNVYKDLGLANPEQMFIKATLAAKIAEILAQRGLTQVEAAKLLGIPQPKVSALLRGQFRGISEAKMLECLNRLGRDIDIVVRKPSRTRADGRTNVVFA